MSGSSSGVTLRDLLRTLFLRVKRLRRGGGEGCSALGTSGRKFFGDWGIERVKRPFTLRTSDLEPRRPNDSGELGRLKGLPPMDNEAGAVNGALYPDVEDTERGWT
jgi:hypothetical protein